MSTKNINKTLMMLVMILKFANLSQPPLKKEKLKDIVIYEGENDSSTDEEIIVLHLFVKLPEVNLPKTLIEPILAPINQKKVVNIKPIISKKDKNIITKETKENEILKESNTNKTLTSKEEEKGKQLNNETKNIEEFKIEQDGDAINDSTPNNKDVYVKTKKKNLFTIMVIGSVLITIFISAFFIISISCSYTLTKKMFAFVPLCIISIAFGYLAKELPIVVPILGICLLFIIICN